MDDSWGMWDWPHFPGKETEVQGMRHKSGSRDTSQLHKMMSAEPLDAQNPLPPARHSCPEGVALVGGSASYRCFRRC